MCDQNIRAYGQKVPFMGQEAYTTMFPAKLAFKKNIPIVMFRGIGEGYRHRAIVKPALPKDFETYWDRMKAVNDHAARCVQENKEDGYWFQDRWGNILSKKSDS